MSCFPRQKKHALGDGGCVLMATNGANGEAGDETLMVKGYDLVK